MKSKIVPLLGIILVLSIDVWGFTHPSNMKLDPAEDRVTISCVDHKPPQVRLLNPVSGTIVVVDCEREK